MSDRITINVFDEEVELDRGNVFHRNLISAVNYYNSTNQTMKEVARQVQADAQRVIDGIDAGLHLTANPLGSGSERLREYALRRQHAIDMIKQAQRLMAELEEAVPA